MTSPIDNFVASGGTSGAPAQPNSRYNKIGTATFTRPDGAVVRYLNRRIIPQPDQYTTMRQYVVVQGARIDMVANTQMGDPLLYWILCDANAASDPDALTAEPGRVLLITLPAGIGTAGGAGRASGLYLTLLVGPVVPLPAPKPVVDALTSITVTTSATGRSGFQLSFTLADRSVLQALFLLAPPGIEIRVVIMVTVNGIPQVLMDGVMREHEVQPSAGSGASSLTITGEDLAAVMDLLPMDGLPLPMPPELRVGAILAKYAMYGVVPEILPPLIPDITIPVERIPAQEGTDFAYINSLANLCGYVFYLDPGPFPGVSRAYWGPQTKFGVPQPALSVNMDTWTNVEQLSFRYAPYKAAIPIVTILDPDVPAPIPIPIPTITPLNPPLGALVPTPIRVERFTEVANKDAGPALLQGMAKASANADVVTGTGSLDVLHYGRVLQARQLVGVRGAGPAFDGLHYVDSVTHTISRGQYKQSFTLTRNALVSYTPVVPTFGL